MSNWFTTQHVSSLSPAKKLEMVEKLEEVCEHVSVDSLKLHCISREMDSFGPVCEFGLCKACFEKMKQEEAEKMVVCYDCHQSVRRADTILWKWYDFYAPQGDEPMIICSECSHKPKHILRVKEDNRARDIEMNLISSVCEEDTW